MTSKEVLYAIQQFYVYNGAREKFVLLEDFVEPIKKDLEVLETLKRNLCFYGCCIDFYREEEKNINTKIDITDYKIIEGWLKNE